MSSAPHLPSVLALGPDVLPCPGALPPSLHFTLWSTFVIWNLFPVAWTVERIPSLAHLGEPLWLFSNFAAKVCRCCAPFWRAGTGRTEGGAGTER